MLPRYCTWWHRIWRQPPVTERACGLNWRWERQGALDAVLQLQDGRTAALSRIGSTHTGEAVFGRMRTLQNMHDRGAINTTMLLVPGMAELERALNYARERSIRGVFATTETEILSSPIGSWLWHTPGRDLLSSREALEGMPPSDMPRTRRPEQRRTMPSETLEADADEQDRVATGLSAPARTLLRLLHDWPLARVSQLQRMTGISAGHLGRAKGRLSRAGLVHHLRIGRTPKQRRDNETRVVLSAAGLRYLSRVDRSSEQLMREQWLVEPHESGDATYRIPGFRVVGTKSRTLLRERRHTDGVYDFVSLLMASCRESRVWTWCRRCPRTAGSAGTATASAGQDAFATSCAPSGPTRRSSSSIRTGRSHRLCWSSSEGQETPRTSPRRLRDTAPIMPRTTRGTTFRMDARPSCSCSRGVSTPLASPGTRRPSGARRCRFWCPALRTCRMPAAYSGTAGCIPGAWTRAIR